MDKQYRITREEAIQILSTRDAHGVLCGYTSGVTEALDMAIEALENKTEWIPCSERLPNTNEVVIMSYKTTDKVHVGKYLDDGSENPWWSYIDDCCAWNNVVTAWMPLPKPYIETSEVEE